MRSLFLFPEVKSLRRMASLEEQARHALDALELAASLGDFQISISSLHEPTLVLREAVSRICSIADFDASVVYLVDESSSDFYLAYAEQQEWVEQVKQAVDSFIDSGMFAFALQEGRPVVVHSTELQCKVLLHVLETSSRVRGMFVGVLPDESKNLSAIEMALLSIVCKNCASAVEIFELYRCFKSGGEDLALYADSLPTGVVDLDGAGRLLFVNKAASLLLDSTVHPDKRLLTDFLVEEEKERMASLIRSCYTFGENLAEYATEQLSIPSQPMRTQTTLHTEDGQQTVNIHVTPVLRNDMVVLRAIIALVDNMQEGAEFSAV